MPYVEKRIISGEWLEIIRYSISKKQLARKGKKIPRCPKEKLSLEKQKLQNIKNAELKVKRLMHCNFKDGEDIFLVLTFKDKKNVSEKLAKQELSNFFRRLKYFREKNGMSELKYICCMGLDKRNCIHYHLIINQINWDDLRRIWKTSKHAGRIHIADLEYDSTTGLAGTARYFIENAVRADKKLSKENDIDKHRKRLFKKWSTSRNLEKPKIPKGYPKVIEKWNIKDIPRDHKDYVTKHWVTKQTDYGKYQHIELMKITRLRI